MPNQSIARLSSVFGALSHEPPEPSRRDVEASEKAKAAESAYVAANLPSSPVYHQRTGVLLVPSKRFDGSSIDPPWNMPEPILWDWLRTTGIEHVEERVFGGTNGSFWARYRNFDGQVRSGLLCFPAIPQTGIAAHLSTEYGFEDGYAPIRREQAAYEVMKALGCEDLAPPVSAKEVNLVPLISDAVRERVGRRLRIAPTLVDEAFGTIGLLRALPLNAENFAEYWAKAGPDDVNRWEMVSDRLRHSIYRAILIDFILGVPNRLLCDYLYNRSSDSLALFGFGVSFPNPALTAEWYLAMRKKGWGRRFSGPLEEPAEGSPAVGADSLAIMSTLSGREREEMVITTKQMADGFGEGVATLLIQVMLEIGVPVANIADMVARIVFLEGDAEVLVNSPADYVRSVLVPLRRGFGADDGRIGLIAQTTSQIMSSAMGKKFDFQKTVQEKIQDGMDFKI